jgi:uncharacterized protein (TIGR00369 family)
MNSRNPDYRRTVERIIRAANHVQDLGIQLADLGPGWCEMELVLLPRHYQQDGYVHAGVTMTIADHTAGCAGTSLIAADELVLTAEFNISFLQAATGGRLWRRAEVIKPGRRLIVAESSVYLRDAMASTLVAKARVALAVVKTERSCGQS